MVEHLGFETEHEDGSGGPGRTIPAGDDRRDVSVGIEPIVELSEKYSLVVP